MKNMKAKLFSSSKKFYEHKCSGKNSAYCSTCKISFSSQKTLLIHYESVHIGTVYTCGHCDKAVTSLSALTRHAKTHSQNVFSCEPCSKT